MMSSTLVKLERVLSLRRLNVIQLRHQPSAQRSDHELYATSFADVEHKLCACVDGVRVVADDAFEFTRLKTAAFYFDATTFKHSRTDGIATNNERGWSNGTFMRRTKQPFNFYFKDGS